ncbi:MAG: xanthine dehydrogenase family protein subunit M [Calditrichaceae bacterium]|nr:xanthine dehydrogenase family protein subunit M [Calditrichaceae bacterium]MBN2709805.1 xanthine dehydrogenase family protein subunit M [Calditrichaceae bacterium]RQV95000.1 MAG: xanthine dehydrogenase family protein subunit M [Calditrichota bacterium]
MKNFKYIPAESLEKASQKKDDSVLMAGGTDLLGMIKDDLLTPETVINLKSLKELKNIRYNAGKGLEIGALATITELAENSDVQKRFPVLVQTCKEIASPQLRNVGTVGGNLCQRPRCWYYRGEFNCLRKGGDTCFAVDGENKFHCVVGGGPCYIVHPSDLAVSLLALDASLEIFSNGKLKTVPIDDFFILPEQNETKENILEPGEIVTKIIVPEIPAGSKCAFIKFKERASWDFAVVSLGILLNTNGSTIKNGRIVFGGVAPRPWIDTALNTKLTGAATDEKNLKSLADSALLEAEPMSKNDYKIILVRNLLKQALIDLSKN